MIDVIICLLALAGGGLAVQLYAAARAPLGYEDEQGFHLGNEAQKNPAGCQNKTPG